MFPDLRSEDPTQPKTKVLFLKVKEFLEKRQRPPLVRTVFILPGLTGLFLFIHWSVTGINDPNPNLHLIIRSLTKEIGSLALSALCLLLVIPFKDPIYLTRRVESPSLCERNRDEVFTRSVASMWGSFVGFVLGLLVGLLSHRGK